MIHPSVTLAPGSKDLHSQIDAICDAFEASWVAGRRSRAEDYLDQAPEEHRPALLKELLFLGRSGSRQSRSQPPPWPEWQPLSRFVTDRKPNVVEPPCSCRWAGEGCPGVSSLEEPGQPAGQPQNSGWWRVA